MAKVLMIALSIDEETLIPYEDSLEKMAIKSEFDCELNVVIFTQGFGSSCDSETNYLKIKYVRDDTVYNKGCAISEIREYFTKKALDLYPDSEFIFFTDDDFRFQDKSRYYLDKSVNEMVNNPLIGLINFKRSNKEYRLETISPTFVYTRGGILIRREAYNGWSLYDLPKCTYYEEAILATKIYYNGYDIYSTSIDIINYTKRSGLGSTIKMQYKGREEELTTGGQQQLVSAGLTEYKLKKDGSPNYAVVTKLSPSCIKIHRLNQKGILMKYNKEGEFND